MTEPMDAEAEKMRSGLLGFYALEVLSAYRSQPDRFDLQSDNFEGHIRLTAAYAEQVEDEGKHAEKAIDLRFGFRTLESGDLAVAVFLPDLHRKSSGHLERWGGFRLDAPRWAHQPDERFSNWVQRNLEGSWEVGNGPRYHLSEAIKRINGLTTESVGIPLFTSEQADPPCFPLAQNTHRYQEVHHELYGYLIDGLCKEAIKAIAAKSGKQVELSSDRTIKALRRIVDETSCPMLFAALKKTSDERGKFAHGTRVPARGFPAFEQFENDLTDAAAGLGELTHALEKILGLDASRSLRRGEARRWLPRLTRPAESHYSICRIGEAVGKTIERVEYGYRESHEGCHESEAILLHFGDGSILGIDTGSNAGNLSDERTDLSPEDFHVDFHLSWVPPPAPSRFDPGESET